MALRRRWKVVLWTLCAMVAASVIAAIVLGPGAVLHPLAFCDGWSTARKDIAAGRAYRYERLCCIEQEGEAGAPWTVRHESPTGLPFAQTGLLTISGLAYHDGYDAALAHSNGTGGLSANSVIPKLLKREYLERRFLAEAGQEFTPTSATFRACRGRFEIAGEGFSAKDGRTCWLAVSDAAFPEEGRKSRWLRPWDGTPLRLLLDHDEKTLIVKTPKGYEIFDLPRGCLIQTY